MADVDIPVSALSPTRRGVTVSWARFSSGVPYLQENLSMPRKAARVTLTALLLVITSGVTSAAAAEVYTALDQLESAPPPPADAWSSLEARLLALGRPRFGSKARVLVIPVEFPDRRGTTPPETFADMFFGDHEDSLTSYYHRQSGGRLEVEGEVAGWTRALVRRKLLERAPGVLVKSLYYPALLRRLPASLRNRLSEFHVVVFVMAGPRVEQWSTLLWPHAGMAIWRGRRLPKIVLSEHTAQGAGFSRKTLWHEFGHVLGIPDKYCYLTSLGVPHQCGIKTVKQHCLMGSGRAPCAWCRLSLGWSHARVLNPRGEHRIRLQPLETGGMVAKVYQGRRSRYLLVSYAQGQLRVWQLGEPGRRWQNHLLWLNLECLVAEPIADAAKRRFDLPGGAWIDEVHLGPDGSLQLRMGYTPATPAAHGVEHLNENQEPA